MRNFICFLIYVQVKLKNLNCSRKKIVPASDMMLLNSNPKSLQHRKSHFQFSRDNISDQMSPKVQSDKVSLHCVASLQLEVCKFAPTSCKVAFVLDKTSLSAILDFLSDLDNFAGVV